MTHANDRVVRRDMFDAAVERYTKAEERVVELEKVVAHLRGLRDDVWDDLENTAPHTIRPIRELLGGQRPSEVLRQRQEREIAIDVIAEKYMGYQVGWQQRAAEAFDAGWEAKQRTKEAKCICRESCPEHGPGARPVAQARDRAMQRTNEAEPKDEWLDGWTAMYWIARTIVPETSREELEEAWKLVRDDAKCTRKNTAAADRIIREMHPCTDSARKQEDEDFCHRLLVRLRNNYSFEGCARIVGEYLDSIRPRTEPASLVPDSRVEWPKEVLPYEQQSADWRCGYDAAEQMYHAKQTELRREVRLLRARTETALADAVREAITQYATKKMSQTQTLNIISKLVGWKTSVTGSNA